MTTFNLDITCKAIKHFSNLPQILVAAYCAFDPSMHANNVKVITNFLHSSYGNRLYVGGSGRSEMNYRYIRVIVEIPAGRKTAVEKEDFKTQVLKCCVDYEGKKATECEIEVRVVEIDQNDILRNNVATNEPAREY